jgi:hypothetical protein
LRSIVVAAGASAVATGLLALALFLGATQLDSTTGGAPGAGIALAGFIALAFVLVVPFTAGLVGGLASREPHAVVGSVAGLFATSVIGLFLVGAGADIAAMLRVLLGLAVLSLLTVMGHMLAIAIPVPRFQR